MNHWNTINELQRIAVKPEAWRLVQQDRDAFVLHFTFKGKEPNDWAWVQTARGERKVYKTAAAALKDVARVQVQAVVHTDFMDGIFVTG